jgi:DNA-binding HxlR family transcriptional regulator
MQLQSTCTGRHEYGSLMHGGQSKAKENAVDRTPFRAPPDADERARVRAVLEAVPGRWDVLVLRHLAGGATRPGELLRAINAGRATGTELSRPVLFRVLARLAGNSLVTSEEVPGTERKTLYRTTSLGLSILDRVSQLGAAGPSEPRDWWIPVADETYAALTLPGIDPVQPNVARMYDYWLGGKDNFAADRAAARQVEATIPFCKETCQQNRQFLIRAVTHLAGSGCRQFLDIGTGLPTMENTHEVAQGLIPDARVAYVDNDPVVVAHAQAMLATRPAVAAVLGDLRDPAAIIGDPDVRKLINFDEPVTILLAAVLHFIRDEEEPGELLGTLKSVMAPGSALLITHIPDSVHGGDRQAALDVYNSASAPLIPRSRSRVGEFFEGLELLPPGLVDVRHWRPLPGSDAGAGDPRAFMLGGVGVKALA